MRHAFIRAATCVAAQIFAVLSPAHAEQTRAPAAPRTSVSVETFATGLQNPWGLQFLPDGRLLVTERPGRLRVVTADGKVSAPVAGLPTVETKGQAGLLDVAVDPDYRTNQLVWISYSEPRDGGNGTALAKGKLVMQEGAPRLENVQVVFRQTPTLDSMLHFGSQIVFRPDGTVFLTLGERAIPAGQVQAQDLGSHLGKVIRILPDGTVPQDNPFVGTDGALPEIWSYGHRNMQGAALHPQTGQLYVSEHGPRGGDELNKIVPGGNYGWPLLTEGTEYSGAPINPPAALPDDLVAAERTWVPSPAPSGLMFYTGEMFPQWQGDAFIGALAGTNLIRVDFDGEQVVGDEFLFDRFPHRVRDVIEGPDGAIYLLIDAQDGQILRLSAP